MKLVIDDDRCVLLIGDAADIGDVLAENSVDAIVTDPPAGIAFMAKSWDKDKGGRDAWIAWLTKTVGPAIKALKPGGHALVWALPRTSHWTATALENAGLEIRDVHHHVFGSGFPKSLTSKSAPIPAETGTALKPAVEHWILARKPLDGTVGANFALHGTGVLQIDACRIGGEPPPAVYGGAKGATNETVFGASEKYLTEPHALGRWPAHLSLEHADACEVIGEVGLPHTIRSGNTLRDDSRVLAFGYGRQATSTTTTTTTTTYRCVLGCPVRLLDEQSGETGEVTGRGASRFFYVAKAPRSEKEAGLAHLTPKSGGEATGREDGTAGVANPRAGAGRTGGARNHHPTVKAVELMRWLIRLITPSGGVVLDPFAGSGTTGVAAIAEGLRVISVEQGGDNEEYVPIIEGRLRAAMKGVE